MAYLLETLSLAIESQKVIELRLIRIAWGGREALAEIESMVTEKVTAALEATTTLMIGGSPEDVVARYRQRVAVNVQRLS